MESSNILPSFFHQGDQEIDRHGKILSNVIFSCLDGSDGSTQASCFLWLELDSVFQLVNLGGNLLSFGQSYREETHLDKHITEKLGGLLSNWITGEKDIIFLGPLFNLGLIFIESFEPININVGNIVSSGLFDVGGISKNTDLNK